MSLATERKSRLGEPPVKVACLACRASRTRCDGKKACASCLTKKKDCSYIKSNRGGPRVARKKSSKSVDLPVQAMNSACQPNFAGSLCSPPEVSLNTTTRYQPVRSDASKISWLRQGPDALHLYTYALSLPPWKQSQVGFPMTWEDESQHDWEQLQYPFDETLSDLVMPIISPGAGIFEVHSDQNFDHIFTSNVQGTATDQKSPCIEQTASSGPSHVPISRVYGNNRDILNAYYIFIHQYFPILPPPTVLIQADVPLSKPVDGFEPSSPISLALSAVLTLIPHPDDLNPKHEESVIFRRAKAHEFAQRAMERIEIEAEGTVSAAMSDQAISDGPSSFCRTPFQAETPMELESILAYLVLSVYEYAQRGNIAKMRNRASQAYDAATHLALQERATHGGFEEARRRAWWMTYVCVLQGSISSSTAPIIPLEYRHFQTPLPSLEHDTEAWPAFLDAQQLLLKCTQFTVALQKALHAQSDLATLDAQLLVLDKEINDLTSHYSWCLDTPSPVSLDHREEVLGKSLKAQAQIKLNSARIKLHRYRAFLDVSGLRMHPSNLNRAWEPAGGIVPLPGCSRNVLQQHLSLPELDPSQISSVSSSSACSSPQADSPGGSPFTSLFSAKLCMDAALAASRALEALPYPNPTLINSMAPTFLSNTFLIPALRTMPVFACCAMQSSYAMLMVCRGSRARNRISPPTAEYHHGLDELYSGIQRVLNALHSYSIAFEAVDGMRVQIQEGFDSIRQAQTEYFPRIRTT